MAEDDSGLHIDESTEIGWREYLTDFEQDVFPFFAERGYSKGEALTVWMLNKLCNRLDPEDDE